MSKGIVLISGVNGYIAAVTARAFLEAGFAVRGTVRNLESGKPVIEAFQKYADEGKLEIVQVPDITVNGAFDEAVKGVTAIAHLASPVSLSFTEAEPVIHAALNGTRTILASAQKNAGPQLKSFIHASSVAAVRNDYAPPYTYTEKDWNIKSQQIYKEKGNDTPPSEIYRASKAVAEAALWEFVKSENPAFTVSAINPTFVLGPPAVLPSSPSKINETLEPIFTILSGQPIPPTWGGPVAAFVDVRDVARVFVWAVENPEVSNGERYLTSAGVFNMQAIADILRKAYPNKKIEVGNPGEGYPPDFQPSPEGIVIDASKSIKATGQGYIQFEKLVLDSAKELEKLL